MGMSNDPKLLPFHRVAMGMPVYNGEVYLEESIRSNLAQTFGDFILIIADNASTDRTEEICRDYESMDQRIYYIRNEQNVGAPGNYAKCFELANCDYFRWANADDLAEPNLVEKCVDILDTHPEVVLAYGKSKLIDRKGDLIKLYEDNLHLPEKTAQARFISCGNKIRLNNLMYGLIRHTSLKQTALLQNYKASDINLILELSLYGQFYEIPEYLFSRRIHPGASSFDRNNEKVLKAFWDPSKKKLELQFLRSFYELLKGITRAPIPPKEKFKLHLHVLRRAYWQKRKIYLEILNYLGLNSRI